MGGEQRISTELWEREVRLCVCVSGRGTGCFDDWLRHLEEAKAGCEATRGGVVGSSAAASG